MTSIKLPALASTLALLSGAAFSQTISGTWRGHAKITVAPLAANMSADRKARATQMIQQYQGMVVEIHFKGDRTLTFTTHGGPKFVSPRPTPGTWTQEGKTLTIRLAKDPNPWTATLEKDGTLLDVAGEEGVHYLLGRG